MDKQLEQERKSEIELAMKHWAHQMQAMLDGKFGDGKVGHLVILFDFGNFGRNISWISNARLPSIIQLLEHLLKHIKELADKRIVEP